MKRLVIILGMVLGGTFLAEAALPTLFPALVGTSTTLDTNVYQPSSSGACRLYGIAYNTLDDEYMAAWWGKNSSTYEVRVQRMDIDGNMVGAYIPVASSMMDRINPQISYSPLTNEYLLVYEEYDLGFTGGPHWVCAQRMDPSGNLVGSVQILGYGLAERREPHVAWSESRWFVAWREEMVIGINPTPTNAIKGQFVDTNGKLDGSELTLGIDGSINNKPPRVAYNSASDTLLVVAQDVDNDTFMGFLVDNTAGTMTSKFQIAKPAALGQILPDVAADPDPANPRFLVNWGVWKLALGTPSGLECEIQGQFVKADGTLDGAMVMLQKTTGSAIMEIISSIAFSPVTQEYMVAYEFYLDENLPPEYRVNRLDKNGAVLESEIIVSGPVSGSLVQPTIGPGFGGRFLMLWQDAGLLTSQVYESPNYDPTGGSVNPGPGPGSGSNHEHANGDSAINDTLCGGSAVNGNWGRLQESTLLFGFLLLLAGYLGTRRTLNRSTQR